MRICVQAEARAFRGRLDVLLDKLYVVCSPALVLLWLSGSVTLLVLRWRVIIPCGQIDLVPLVGLAFLVGAARQDSSDKILPSGNDTGDKFHSRRGIRRITEPR